MVVDVLVLEVVVGVSVVVIDVVVVVAVVPDVVIVLVELRLSQGHGLSPMTMEQGTVLNCFTICLFWMLIKSKQELSCADDPELDNIKIDLTWVCRHCTAWFGLLRCSLVFFLKIEIKQIFHDTEPFVSYLFFVL